MLQSDEYDPQRHRAQAERREGEEEERAPDAEGLHPRQDPIERTHSGYASLSVAAYYGTGRYI